MQGFQIFDIILLGMIAAFLLYRLYAALGQKAGNEEERVSERLAERRRLDAERERQERERAQGNARRGDVPAPRGLEPVRERRIDPRFVKPGSPAAAAIEQMMAIDDAFELRDFLDGARMAHEMIVTAFAQGDRRTLKPLLSADVYDGFEQAITQREKAQQAMVLTYVGLKGVTVEGAVLNGSLAEITLRFVGEIIQAVKDGAGTVVSGDPQAVREVIDVWTFQRDLASGNPNWTLVATDAGA